MINARLGFYLQLGHPAAGCVVGDFQVQEFSRLHGINTGFAGSKGGPCPGRSFSLGHVGQISRQCLLKNFLQPPGSPFFNPLEIFTLSTERFLAFSGRVQMVHQIGFSFPGPYFFHSAGMPPTTRAVIGIHQTITIKQHQTGSVFDGFIAERIFMQTALVDLVHHAGYHIKTPVAATSQMADGVSSSGHGLGRQGCFLFFAVPTNFPRHHSAQIRLQPYLIDERKSSGFR